MIKNSQNTSCRPKSFQPFPLFCHCSLPSFLHIVMAQFEYLWVSASPSYMSGRGLLSIFKLLMCQQSYSVSPVLKMSLEIQFGFVFFFFVATDTKVLKATARFPSLSSSEPSTSAISTVRCWVWNLSDPLIKNRGNQHPWKAKLYQTHQLLRKQCARKQENLETSRLQSTE